MLKKQVDILLESEMITIGTDVDHAKTGQMWTFDSERLTKAILNLFKAEIDKLTVIDYEEISQSIREAISRQVWVDITVKQRYEAIADAQLQDTKKQLLDLMGEL